MKYLHERLFDEFAVPNNYSHGLFYNNGMLIQTQIMEFSVIIEYLYRFFIKRILLQLNI